MELQKWRPCTEGCLGPRDVDIVDNVPNKLLKTLEALTVKKVQVIRRNFRTKGLKSRCN